MQKSRVRPEQLFRSVGRLVIRWNDLDLQLRRILNCLTEDWFIATVLTVDLPSANLIQVLRTIVAERDVDATKLNRLLFAISEKTGRPVEPQVLVSEHVNHLLNCADRVRLYRNLYAHCVNSPTKAVPYFTLGGMTVRGGGGNRLKHYDYPLKIAEINRVITVVAQTIKYAERVEKCLNSQKPKWPSKPKLLPELKKPFAHLNERIPLL